MIKAISRFARSATSINFIAPSLTLLSLIAVAACDRSGGPSPSDGASRSVAFVTNNAADFWTIARRGCEKADQELPDLRVDFRIPSDGTAAEQKRLLDDLLARGVDAVAISPVDPANQTQMLNETANQAALITQDSDAPNSNRLFYIGTDNVAAGRQAGELMKEALPQGGKIMIFVGKLDAQNAQDRANGIREALRGSKIEIIDVRTDDTDLVRAKANAADTLVKYPDIAGMIGLWNYNGPAILNAVRDAGKAGAIKIVCFDEDDQTLTGVKDGSIHGTVVQQPYEFGYQAIIALDKILKGDRSVIPADKRRIIPTLVIKKDGVDDFTRKINELRGRS